MRFVAHAAAWEREKDRWYDAAMQYPSAYAEQFRFVEADRAFVVALHRWTGNRGASARREGDMTISEWQREFATGPKVYCVVGEHDENLYESREAAEEDLAWRRRAGRAVGCWIEERNVHTLRLAQARRAGSGLLVREE